VTDRRDREQARNAACERAAVAWLRALRSVDQLLDELVPVEVSPKRPLPGSGRPIRPVRPVRPVASPITREVAERIFRIARDRRRPLQRLDDLRMVPGVDAAVLGHLRNTGCSRLDQPAKPEPGEPAKPEPGEPEKPAPGEPAKPEPGEPEKPEPTPPGDDRDRPANVVGVLLPVRIETRFGPGDLLRVRVVPDEPWFARHDPHPSAGEIEALEDHQVAVAEEPTQTEAAWRRLVHRVGGARAAWLYRSFADRFDDTGRLPDERRPTLTGGEPHWPRIVGFPDQLEIWLARGGGAAEPVATLDVDHTRLLADLPLPVENEDGDDGPDEADANADADADPFAAAPPRWWSSFDEAVDVGLATTIRLGDRTDDIDVLYVIGVGGDAPRELFADHRDAGQLGTIEPGTPTATIDGVPAAETVPGPDTWSRIATGQPASTAQRALSRALTGAADELGRLPHAAGTHDGQGPDPATGPPDGATKDPATSADEEPGAGTLVTALWPALWGHALRDVLGLGPAVDELAAWAADVLAPEGPFPTLRLGGQPYGVLPVTALSRWRPTKDDPPFQIDALPGVTYLGTRLADAAEAAGTAQGADADRLYDLLARTPTSVAYQHRHELPQELWYLLQLVAGMQVDWLQVTRDWEQQQQAAADLEITPARRYGGFLPAEALELPLVVPADLDVARLPAVLDRLVQLAWDGGHDAFGSGRIDETIVERFGASPDSLLLRLVIRSLQLALADVGLARAGRAPHLDPVAAVEGSPDLIAAMNRVNPHQGDQNAPAMQAFRRVTDAVGALGRMDVVTLERRLRATLDVASHRIDPWVTGLATRRLQGLQAAVDARGETPPMRLGAYGWVDRPRPGFTGPTEGGLLHAPSEPQATTAAILRDRAVADPEPGRFDLGVDSASARLAEQLGDAVRDGLHLSEVVGAEVERLVEDRGRIDALRAAFPVRTEHAGRRVCDGLAVLDADPATLPLDGQAPTVGFAALRDALDTYSDLLVAEAVYEVVQGRAETAGASMDAAAGRARPPDLDVLHTDREGRSIATACVLVLEDVPTPEPTDDRPLATLSPGEVAEPALAALLTTHLGGPQAWRWTLTDARDDVGADVPGSDGEPDGDPPRTWDLDLRKLDLAPIDAVALPLVDLERLVETVGGGWIVTEPDRAGEPYGAGEPDGGRRRYARAVSLLDGASHAPAEPQDLVLGDDRPRDDTAQELRARLARLRQVAEALLAAIDDAETADDDMARREVLRAASRWGIAPDPGPGGAALASLAARARAQLQSRLAASPREPDHDGERPDDLDATTLDATTLDASELAERIVELASGTGHLAVFARLHAADLPDGLTADTGAIANEWLPTVAEVREPLARFDSAMLAEELHDGAPLRAWSTRPHDPWQTAVADADQDDGADDRDEQRLLVAYAPQRLELQAVEPDATVAVALIDRWSETVPVDHHATAAAFGYDAPASRAPQAILLTVPPVLGRALDTPTCASILAETRTLLRARMAPPGADPGLAALLPTVLLPASGPSAVRLDPTSGDAS
jgi:hypothetical protein